jgi:hypothetical protein
MLVIQNDYELVLPPIQAVPMALSWRVKQQGHEAGHSLLSNVEIKNGGTILPLPHMSSRRGVLVISTRDNCTLLILIRLHLRLSYIFSRPTSEQKRVVFYHRNTHVGSTPDLLGQFHLYSGLLRKTELKQSTNLRFSRRILEYYFKIGRD